MYPQPELKRGVAHKAAVRRRIARQRAECVVALTQAARPLALVDRMATLWRQLAPYAGLAAVAFSFRRKRGASRHPGWVGSLLRWGPILSGVLRLFRSKGNPR